MLKVRVILISLAMLCVPVLSLAEVVVDNEQYEHDALSGSYSAELTNNYDTAISKVDFVLLTSTPGRSVPWSEGHYVAPIPGGIEPGETYLLRGSGPAELIRASEHEVKVKITITRAYDADGNEIK